MGVAIGAKGELRLDATIEAGALFRVLMEFRYRRTWHWLCRLGVEIFIPSRGEFVVGDIPTLTVRKGLPSAEVNGGIGICLHQRESVAIAKVNQ